jgi:hypothetical protein
MIRNSSVELFWALQDYHYKINKKGGWGEQLVMCE